MTTLREAAQQALEALENCRIEYNYHGNPIDEENANLLKSIDTLRAALAEPEQRPTSDVTEAVTKTVIEVEKLLCGKLGKQWQPSGMSIQTLVDELAAPPTAAPEPKSKTPAWWMDGLTATLMREGVNKHRAKEIAKGYWEAYCQVPMDEEQPR